MEFQIYIASIKHYNEGQLVGEWIDLSGKDENDIQDAINDFLEKHNIEEYAIHDHENLEDFYSEYGMNWEKVSNYIKACEEYGHEAAQAFIAIMGAEYANFEEFEYYYRGQYKDEGEFAYYFLEETGRMEEIPRWALTHFDYDSYGDELFSTDFNFYNGHVFYNR